MYLNIMTNYHLMTKNHNVFICYLIQTLTSMYLYIFQYEYLKKFLYDMNHFPTWDIYSFCDEFVLFQCHIYIYIYIRLEKMCLFNVKYIFST